MALFTPLSDEQAASVTGGSIAFRSVYVPVSFKSIQIAQPAYSSLTKVATVRFPGSVYIPVDPYSPVDPYIPVDPYFPTDPHFPGDPHFPLILPNLNYNP